MRSTLKISTILSFFTIRKKIIILLLLCAALSKSLYAFSLSASTNRVKVSQTATVTVGDISGSPTSYEWSANTGSITGSGASVTYTAPSSKGKATVSVTVKNGATTLWSGSVSMLVYKTIILIKTDDYFYCEWSPSTGYERPQWKAYHDYMINEAKVKTSLGLTVSQLNSDTSGAWANVMKARVASGYLEIYCHGYEHERFSNNTYEHQLSDLQNSVSLCLSKTGITIHGLGTPENANNDDTARAMNAVPEMKFFYFPNPTTLFTGLNFMTGQTRLDCESGGGTFKISEATYLSQYNLYKDRPVNVIQIHPVWWDESQVSMGEWKKIIADMKTQGVTVLLPYEYYRMTTEPSYVPDEQTGGTPADTTAPSNITTVNDGTGTDIGTINSTTQLSANWTAATDAESGIAGYKYAIGTRPAVTDVASWTTLGNVTTVTRTGLSLTNGTRYYFTVKAVNGESIESAQATNSNGQTVSVTPPSAPAQVRDGTSATQDIGSTNSTTQLSANWDAATDTESGIARYYYAIGTTAGGTNVVDWTDNGTSTGVVKTGLTLTLGTKYYFSVKAQNGAGMQGAVTSSNGQTLTSPPGSDTTPPVAIVSVRDGTQADTDSTAFTAQLSANWEASADAESGIAKYYYAIGTSQGCTDVLDWTDNGTATSVTKTGLALTIGAKYYFSVKAQNGAGLYGSITNSDGAAVKPGMVFSDNFENWTTPQGQWDKKEEGAGSINASIEEKKSGSRSLKITCVDDPNSGITCIKKNLPESKSYYTRFYLYLQTGFFAGLFNKPSVDLFNMANSKGSRYVTLALRRHAANSVFVQVNNNWEGTYPSIVLNENQWYCVEVLAPEPTSASEVKFWLDGRRIGSFVTDLSAAASWTELNLGPDSESDNHIAATMYFDEVVVADSYIGPLDTPAPAISNTNSADYGNGKITITWDTADASTSQVEYGLTPSYGSITPLEEDMVTSHSVEISGLTQGVEYHYRALSRNVSGMEAVSGNRTFMVIGGTHDQSKLPRVYPNPCSLSRQSGIKFRLNGTGEGTVKIYTLSGKPVRKLSGTIEISWDGSNEDGEKVVSGIYLYQITSGNGDLSNGNLAVVK